MRLEKILTQAKKNILEQAKSLLKDGGLNFREKANIYGGAVLGLLGPIIATRYALYGFHHNDNIGEEALKWGSSIAMAPAYLIGLPLGIFHGCRSAKALKGIRREREKYKHTGLKIFDC